MDIFGAVLLMLVMYIVAPVGICLAALIAFGGAERLLPGGARERALTRQNQQVEHH